MSLLSIIGDVWSAQQAESGLTGLGLTASAVGESTLANPQPWLNELLGGMPGATGKVVTPQSAMRVSAVYACVSVLRHAVGQIPMVLMRVQSDGSMTPAKDHPLYRLLLSQPNPEMTAQDCREMDMNHLLLRGNCFRQIVRSGGEVEEINPLHPDAMRMYRLASGELAYEYTDPWSGGQYEFRQREIWRTIGMSFNGLQGLSVLSYARECIGLAMATEEHAAKLFSNGAQIATAFEHPGEMSAPAQERFLASVKQKYSGSANAFKTIILEEGMKASKLALNNVDSQFIQGREFQTEEICRFFEVPPHKIQHLLRATFNNIEHLSMDFKNSSLMHWIARFEQTSYRDLLLPNEQKKYVIRADTTMFDRGDTAALVNMVASGIANTWLNPNEARRMFGLNPREGGDKYENPNTSTGKAKPGEPVTDPKEG